MHEGKLSFSNYSHSYRLPGFPPIKALSNVSLMNIVCGEIVCIVGPNGSGKSTLFLSILGLMERKNESGDVLLNDNNVELNSLSISYIPQKPNEGLIFDLSIIENILLHMLREKWPKFKHAISKEVRHNVIQLLNELDLNFLSSRLDMPPNSLSGGEQQVLNAVAAVYTDADLIISDEPTSKLDEQNRMRIIKLLVYAAHKKRGRVIFTTHDLIMAQMIADRIIYLDQGRVVNEEQVRAPLSSRNIPEIRLVNSTDELCDDVKNVNESWWKPGDNCLFSSIYMIGDDSVDGYLFGRSLNREQRTIREVEGLLKLAGVSDGSRVRIADIPCGWGRHSIELSKRNFSVTGVDLSSEFISIAQKQSKLAGLSSVVFQNGDMKQLDLENCSFDLVLNIWTSFGFFGPEDDIKVLKEFSRILRKGGMLLIHSDLNPIRVGLGIFDEPKERLLQSGETLSVNEWFCKENSWIYGIWELKKAGIKKNYRIRIYSVDEWKEMAIQAGFEFTHFVGNLDSIDNKLTGRSQEFVIILKKADF